MSRFGALRSRLDTLRADATGESRRRRLAWVAVAAVLVLAPLAITVGRAPEFKASVQLFPRAVGPYAAVFDIAYYRSLLEDPALVEPMRLSVRSGVAEYEDVTFSRGRPGQLVVTVAAPVPADAQRFVNVLAPQIAGATRQELARVTARDVAELRARLRSRLAPESRRALRRRLSQVERLGPLPPGRVLYGSPAALPRMERWADRLIDDLPGAFPPRPSPLWAALAGLLVAVTLWATWLVLVPPDRPRRR